MLLMPMRAQGIFGETIEFDILDSPKSHDENLFMLTKRGGTPLLRTNTLVRGADLFSIDGTRVYENDIIRALNGAIYQVYYSNGFRVRNVKSKTLVQLEDLGIFEIAGTVEDYLDAETTLGSRNVVSQLHYKTVEGTRFRLFNIVMAKGDLLIVKTNSGLHRVTKKGILQSCGKLSGQSTYVYLGEEFPESKLKVVMKRGVLYITDGTKGVPVPEMED